MRKRNSNPTVIFLCGYLISRNFATAETFENDQITFIRLCITYLTKFLVGSNRRATIVEGVNFLTINVKSVTALCKFHQNFLQLSYK